MNNLQEPFSVDSLKSEQDRLEAVRADLPEKLREMNVQMFQAGPPRGRDSLDRTVREKRHAAREKPKGNANGSKYLNFRSHRHQSSAMARTMTQESRNGLPTAHDATGDSLTENAL